MSITAQREEIRPAETVFCWDTFGPGIHVDVYLTHTTYVKIVLDHINPFMVLLDGSGSFNQIMYVATLHVAQEWFKAVVLKLFQEEAPLRRVNSFVAPPKENSWRKHPQTYNFTYKF